MNKIKINHASNTLAEIFVRIRFGVQAIQGREYLTNKIAGRCIPGQQKSRQERVRTLSGAVTPAA
jgi:hypothetical protein